jgi:monoterpene epsilon-lactone hydrolase
MSLQNEIIKFVMKYRRKTMEKQDFDILDIRQKMDDLFVKTFITPWTVNVTPMTLAGVEAEIITPSELQREDAIILYVHGGGYFMGNIDTHRPLAGWIVHESGIPAITFNYRLAPENPFPAGRDDIIRVYSKLKEEYSPDRIIMVGDSAGGGLIMQSLLAMKSLNIKMPRCCCLLSPFLDLTCSSDSIENNAASDPFIIPKFIRGIIPHYIKHPYYAEHPEANPLYADLSGLPPLLIHVGSIEVLVDDSKKLADRCKKYKVECELKEFENLPHVWHFNRQFFMPESQQALKEIGNYIQERIPKKEPVTIE